MPHDRFHIIAYSCIVQLYSLYFSYFARCTVLRISSDNNLAEEAFPYITLQSLRACQAATQTSESEVQASLSLLSYTRHSLLQHLG